MLGGEEGRKKKKSLLLTVPLFLLAYSGGKEREKKPNGIGTVKDWIFLSMITILEWDAVCISILPLCLQLFTL